MPKIESFAFSSCGGDRKRFRLFYVRRLCFSREEDLGRIFRPAEGIRHESTQVGETLRRSTVKRHRVDFLVSLFLSRKSNCGAVGGDARQEEFTPASCETPCQPAFGRNMPEVVFAGEK